MMIPVQSRTGQHWEHHVNHTLPMAALAQFYLSLKPNNGSKQGQK